MFGEKQEQKTESGSTAIQAGRDVNIHGLSVAEVRDLCQLFLQNNFPQLREEARIIAEQHVREFTSTLENRLVKDAASIVFDKFREPDVQASINDAVMASARKGAAANPNILSTLISERVSRQSSDYKNIVLSEAVHVVPKLTAPQISLLSFVHFVASVAIQGLQSVGGLEPFGQIAYNFSQSGFGLSESQKQHIQYSGACSVNNMVGGDIYDSLHKSTYAYLGITELAKFKDAVSKQAPSFAAVLDQFNKDNLFTIQLTSVGQAIAIANISNYLGKLDYSIWLK